MNKKELQSRAEELGIKYQENDTNENLALMIAGKESAEKLDEKDKALAEKSAEVKVLESENTKLQGLLEEKELAAKAGGAVVVKHKSDMYKIIGNVKHNKVEYTPETLAKDNNAVAELVKKGSGILVKLEKGEA